jgi:hypothetical protein
MYRTIIQITYNRKKEDRTAKALESAKSSYRQADYVDKMVVVLELAADPAINYTTVLPDTNFG